jgi:serine/threonine-protein kinase
MLRDLLENEHYVQQFIREAVITARLQHPHVIPVYDMGFFTDGQLFYSMRYVDGKQLDELPRDVPLADRLRILRSAALAVHHAHSLGLWHRDLKPQNVLIGDLGETYVIDWGLVSVQNGREYRVRLPKIVLGRKTIVLPDNLIKETEKALTAAPGFMGPPAYMAPEQLAQDELRMGAVSDVWAMGIMLFEALTGQHPLEDYKQAPSQLMPSVLAETMPSPLQLAPDASPELSALCERMLIKDPSRRMQDLSEFIVGVKQYLRIRKEATNRAVSDREPAGATHPAGDAPTLTTAAPRPIHHPTVRPGTEPTICRGPVPTSSATSAEDGAECPSRPGQVGKQATS